MEQIRINKYLTQANYCSRREADRLIEEGQVKINGIKAKLGDKVTSKDSITVNGKNIHINKDKTYLAYYKPVGVITTSDLTAKDNIIQRINYPDRVYPIGRLDVKTEGLILLTNDGDIVNKILKSQEKVEKEYIVTVDRTLTPEDLSTLSGGVQIAGRKTLPAKLKKLSDTSFTLTLVEGRHRQIRQMCEALGILVTNLIRVRIGNINLGQLRAGEYRIYNEIDFKRLLKIK